jgi:uncharacterized membrane protein YphA (DoxX/SURF4 family)
MNVVYLLGRIILGGFFIMSGISHFQRAEMMAGYAASKGVPAAKLAVLATGVQLLAGGLLLLLGWQVWLGALILVLFLVPTALIMHNFWTAQEPQARMTETVQFMKNLAIAGALLMIMAYSWGGSSALALGH